MNAKIIFYLAIITLTTTNVCAQAANYLALIPKYNEASAFEDEKYSDKTWKDFYMLDEANELVDPLNYDFDLLNAAVFFATNKYRASKGIAALRYEPRLRDAASIHSYEMVRRNFFDHVNNYDAKIRMPNNRTELCGYEGARIAENLARDFMDMLHILTYTQLADKTISDLSKSREHNTHLLDPNLNQLGCALIFEERPNADGYWFWRVTQSFGRSW